MKQILKSVLVFLPLSFLVLLMVIQPTFAQRDDKNPNTIVLPKGEVVDRNYFASGGAVVLSGTVNGDAYVAGGNIVFDGTVNGDLLAIGGMVDIRGTVTGDVRVIGGQVIASGTVEGNMSTLSGSTSLANTAKINGSFVGAGGSFSLFAPIGRSVDISAGQAIIGSTLGDNANITAGQVTLTPEAKIAGNLTYTSNNKAQIEQGAQIGGTTTQNFPPQQAPSAGPLAFLAGISLLSKIISFVTALVIGLLLLRFMPNFTQSIADTIDNKPWLSLGLGFLIAILFPILFIILLITLIGIPIALILLAIFLILLYLAKIFVSYWIGEKILGMSGRKLSSGWTLFIGLVIYIILTLIPVFGWLISTLVAFIGLGAVIIEKRNWYFQ